MCIRWIACPSGRRTCAAEGQDMCSRICCISVEYGNAFDEQAKRAARNANLRLEELAFDLKRKVAKWDREYGVSDKAREAADFAAEQVQNVDRQLGIRQKARNATTDLRLKWPTVFCLFLSPLLLSLNSITCMYVWGIVAPYAALPDVLLIVMNNWVLVVAKGHSNSLFLVILITALMVFLKILRLQIDVFVGGDDAVSETIQCFSRNTSWQECCSMSLPVPPCVWAVCQCCMH